MAISSNDDFHDTGNELDPRHETESHAQSQDRATQQIREGDFATAQSSTTSNGDSPESQSKVEDIGQAPKHGGTEEVSDASPPKAGSSITNYLARSYTWKS